ncbi:ABC transporter permease [Saccharothrix coeruleofusca]|uniref:Transporter n=1 Tax=Saccharothrix coeruleofusca TaxID=33919 RepID=A0A918AM36_9PSEU|nr:ABC transporter permease [Saccharothrix coeruleofusca]MBP2336201.1 putative Mn2+ efflux pump MntP [Saccharothrix coeruleofusca]GGP54689.1 transporter [Saccharothrix coeruleofusca]
MTWVAWRQQRLQVLISLAIITALAAVMVYTGFDARSLDETAVEDKYGMYLGYLQLLLLALPVLLGAFAGGPLFAREIEQGAHVFSLTQSIGRTRWWATKIAVAGLPVVLGMTLLGLVNAWADPALSTLRGARLAIPSFEVQGVAIGAYTALAFTLGATAGLLVRNTLGAMVTAIVGYVPVLIAVGNGLRPHYAEPQGGVVDSTMLREKAWRVETSYVDGAGNPVDLRAVCGDDVNRCFEEGKVRVHALFHPDDRFWAFQAVEAGVFLALSAALLGLGAWVLHRRLRLA